MPTEQPNCSESTESSSNSSSVVLHPLPQINSKNRLKRCRGEEEKEKDKAEEDEDFNNGSPNSKIRRKNDGNISNVKSNSSSSSSFVGVRMRAWGKWVSEIREPKKKSRIWLGTFATPEMAARAHDVAAMSIKGTSAILNFPQFAHLLPRPVTCSPRDVQAAAVKAAHMDHLNPNSSSSSSSSSSLPEPSTTTENTSIMSSSSSLSLASGITSSSSSSSQDDEESRLLLPPKHSEAAAQQDELGEIVELPRLGTSYESVEPTQEVLSLFESEEWWDNYGNSCEYFFGEENYINMEFTGLENVLSSSFGSFLWQH